MRPKATPQSLAQGVRAPRHRRVAAVRRPDAGGPMIRSMRVSVEMDEGTLNDLRRLTGKRKMSPAISRAVTEFVRRQRVRELGRLLREGAFDYPLTNEEIESGDR